MDNNYKLESQDEVFKRQREIDILVNVIEPDPHYQRLFISDRAMVFDAFGDWELVDVLKQAGCF
jgi:hypothetical protein